jgi:hypothetical protein
MPATKRSGARKATTGKATTRTRSTAKSTARGRVTSAAKTAARRRHESNRRAVDRVKKALDRTQKEIAAIRGTFGNGRKDLRKDAAKLLREAGRDVEKMQKAVLGDLDRLQKELTGAAKGAKPKSVARKPRKSAARPSTRAKAKRAS